MRTTLRIDDELYRAVKVKAAMAGRTVASVLEDAIRASLRDAPAVRATFTVAVTGSGGLRPGIDLASNGSVADAATEEAALDAMR